MNNPIKQRSPWGGWWLIGITIGIYYLVWFHKVNAELAAATGQPHAAWGRWWNQIIPIWGCVGIYRTAQRINEAHAARNSSVQVSPLIAWLVAPIWFFSQQRYLQRRVNSLGDLIAAQGSADPRPLAA
ncbi:hypothetical protein [Nocardia lasii]|uniref:DUF4234 domain-containing protein n=1 Tax=Nocardia lasii TaxID=1616107 RepID=A0ABW1JNK1_9NOCA